MLMARRLGPSDGVVLEYIGISTTSSTVPRALISRERVPKSNTWKYKKRGNSDPKNMRPPDRIEEFPGENLCLRGRKLFCNGCKEILSSKKSILKNHLASKKHAAGKEELKVTKKRDHVSTCVFATLKTVRLEGGLCECSFESITLISLWLVWSGCNGVVLIEIMKKRNRKFVSWRTLFRQGMGLP